MNAVTPRPLELVYASGEELKMYLKLYALLSKVSNEIMSNDGTEWSFEYCYIMRVNALQRTIMKSEGFLMRSDDIFVDDEEDELYLKSLYEKYTTKGVDITIRDILKMVSR
jgi:hypothetical protein